MTTWTIRADDILDQLVGQNVKSLGYSSKAEFIREAVREFILRRNAGRLGLLSLEQERNAAKKVDVNDALKRLASLSKDKDFVDNIVKEERDIIERALLHCTGESGR